ncbi:MAG: M28 family peptidase [Dehalococcoidia bacterium]|nr:MAG: M28 family peptidase [Dehalococcoidia bacterium]
MLSDFEFNLQHQLSGLKALSNISELAKVGYRFVGTEGDRKSIEFMKKQFKSYGLDVVELPIRVPTFEDEKPLLKILATGEELECIAPLFSPSTPPGGLEANLVLIGDGTEEDYRRVNVRGKIVVLPETTVGFAKFWLGTFAERAAQAGAVGMVIIHPMPWPYRMTMEAGYSNPQKRFCEQKLPAVCISAIDGLKLMHAIGKGETRVRLETKNLIEERDSVIISAFRRGTEYPEERVGIIAHRDSAIALGANDNGSGSGTILEIARVLSQTKPKRSFEFISSTAEDGATVGAYKYCEVHKEDLVKNMKALLDIDMLSGAVVKQIEVGHWPDTEPIKHPAWLLKMVDDVAAELGYGFGRLSAMWGVPEEGRFIDIGVPATVLWANDDPYYHSIHDTVDKVNPANLKAAADTIAIVAWRLANSKIKEEGER